MTSDQEPPSPGEGTQEPDLRYETGFYEAYVGFARNLRVWFIAYGIGGPFELGMRPLTAHCHLGLGKLYRCTDKREQAREHLTTATTMYREMGMTYWLNKVDTELEQRL